MMMTTTKTKPTRISKWIYLLPESPEAALGYQVRAQIRDQFGDLRKITTTFRTGDPDADKIDAFVWRDEIDAKREDVRWLREQFEGKKQKKVLTLAEVFALAGTDWATATLSEYVELGLHVDDAGGYTIDETSDERGYLRRIIEETSKGNASSKAGIWTVIQDWGGIHEKRLNQISGEDVDDFVRWMESRRDGDKAHYSKSSIRGYRMTLRSMIKGFARKCRQPNPLDIHPSMKKPARVKGRRKKRRVPTSEEMTALEKGFDARIVEGEESKRHKRYLPRRKLAYAIHQVLKGTGMRPGEAFYLRDDHVHVEAKQIVVEGSAIKGEGGMTKGGKIKGDASEGTRVVPVSQSVIDVIQDWLSERVELGFPDSDIIFCDENGGYVTDGSLRTHYVGACRAGGLESNVTPYMMRHHRNDELRRRGMPVEVRRAIIGHVDDATNLNYTDPQAEEARAWMDD